MLFLNAIRRIQSPAVTKMLSLKKEDVVLDAGCGSGFFSYKIAKKCGCFGIDKHIKKELISKNNKPDSLKFLNGNVQKLPFKNESFSKLLLSNVLQMVKNDVKALKECNRVLKKGGIMVLSVPVEYCCVKSLNKIKKELIKKFKSEGKGFYKYNEIASLLKNNGFKVIEKEYSPKNFGSFVYESWIYLCYHLGLPLSHWLYFPLIYPLMLLDKFCNKKNVGCEIIIKAKKFENEA